MNNIVKFVSKKIIDLDKQNRFKYCSPTVSIRIENRLRLRFNLFEISINLKYKNEFINLNLDRWR
jgi:hypothetical protein